jgi:erythronate-4-phosphate dehydrogenase
MNIVVDENISYAEEAFSRFGNVSALHGRKINNEVLRKADVLIVRSITRVDESLLDGSSVQFVGTATIGTDHVDLEYLKSAGIGFSDAKGCNADAVTEYVFTAIIDLLSEKNVPLKGRTIGIVGAGNIGGRVARIAETIGMQVLKNDPPLERMYGSKDYVPLDEIYGCDMVTFHVPLNKTGPDKTVHLMNGENLKKLKDNVILINASRGQVVDNKALIEVIGSKDLRTVLDVWENEPGIDTALLERVKTGTPHIAGYSLEGKVNGTAIIYNALCRFLGEEPVWKPTLPVIKTDCFKINPSGNSVHDLNTLTGLIYDIKKDDSSLRKITEIPKAQIPKYFDTLRKEYPLRREFSNFKIELNRDNEELTGILKALRFATRD